VKIRLLSDLHLEGNRFYYEYAGEDLVVLAGDIHTQGRHDWLLDQIPANVKILFVPGNHEYYGAVFETVNEYFYELQAQYSNFYYLDNEGIHIDGIEFFGGTMFTDLNLYGDVAKASEYACRGIADFSWIDCRKDTEPDFENFTSQERRWTPADHINQHSIFRKNIQQWIQDTKDKKRVVISHFVPHPDASDPKFAGSVLNPYFISNMEPVLADVDVWLFGHTHHSCDKIINGCHLVCNPHGYGSENSAGFRKDLILEV
jgi:predicted phosphodiesterase